MIYDPFVIEHDYAKEEREVSAYYKVRGYLLGRNRESGQGFEVQNMVAWEGTYYVARAFMSGYREGLKIPYKGKLKMDYHQKKKLALVLENDPKADLSDLL